MIELKPPFAVSRLLRLFDRDVPTEVRLACVFEGRNPGTVLVDDAHDPTWCVVREAGWGHTFIGGRPDARQLTQAISELRRESYADVISWDGDTSPLLSSLPPDRVEAVLEFSGRSADDPTVEKLIRKIPKDCIIRRMDERLIEKCLWAADMARAFGSLKGFLQTGLGFCLMREEEILCEAYAVYWAAGSAEIGVITHEKHRRLGYASMTCAYLVRACEERGYQTTWTCASENVASGAVARRLGHRREREFRLNCYWATDSNERSSVGQ